MDLDTFIVAVHCTIDDELRELAKQERWRTRGPRPCLADPEVLTMEVVGEYLGIDTDRGLYAYFRRHYGARFAALGRVHRTTFVRQAANLWMVKELIWQRLVRRVPHEPDFALVDSFPPAGLPVRSRPPLPAVPGRGRLREGHAGPADVLRVPCSRPSVLAGPDRAGVARTGQRFRVGRCAGAHGGNHRPGAGWTATTTRLA